MIPGMAIILPPEVSDGIPEELRSELRELADVEDAGTVATRGLLAPIMLWVTFAAGAIQGVEALLGLLQRVTGRVREKGIQGAEIEFPNGVRVSVDSVSTEELESLISSWKNDEASDD